MVSQEQIESAKEYLSGSSLFLALLGGIVKVLTEPMTLKTGICKILVGCIVAFVANPIVEEYTNRVVYPMVIFLVGYGGVEIVEAVHKVFVNELIARIKGIYQYLFNNRSNALISQNNQ